jgi:hypothetical protein
MERPLWHHLRLLPGGDTSIGAAITTTLTIGGLFFFVGLIVGAILIHEVKADVGNASVLTIATALPFGLISLWTGLRVRTTKPIATDEAGVEMRSRRVYYGDEVGRVPVDAVVVSTKPRQVRVTIKDGRALTIFFRVNGDPDDLVGLAEIMSKHDGLEVEDWVHARLKALADDLLPDPDAIKEALADELLRRGVVVTRCEAT